MNTSKQINAMIILLALLLVGVGAYTVWDPFRQQDEEEITRELIAKRAAHTFATNCRVCHGNEGEGRIGPALNPAARKASSLSDFTDPTKRNAAGNGEYQQLVTNTISCGRIGTVMPPWAIANGGSLNSEQIRQLMILITEDPSDAWNTLVKPASEEADRTAMDAMKQEDLLAKAQEQKIAGAERMSKPELIDALLKSGYTTLAAPQDVLKGASTTGATTSICGQKPVGTPTPSVTPTPPPVTSSWTENATDNKFDVTAMAVTANQQATLVFNNRGAALHNWHVQGVKGTNGQDVTFDLTPGGQSRTVTFTIAQTGAYTFICDAHPNDMRGTLFVQ